MNSIEYIVQCSIHRAVFNAENTIEYINLILTKNNICVFELLLSQKCKNI